MTNSGERLVAGAFCIFGWLSSFSYPFHLIAPHLHACDDGNALPYLVSLVVGPATLAMAALLLTLAAGFGVVVRWPSLLHLGTAAAAVIVLPSYLVSTTIEGHFICAANAAGGPTDHPATTWQRAFAPTHDATVVLFGGFLLWYWRRAAGGEA